MKQIVMLAAKFANERDWARVMSQFARVSLVQLDGVHFKQHTEIWEDGQCTFLGSEKKAFPVKKFDQALLGLPLSVTTLKHCWPGVKNQKTDVIIANANSMTLTALFLRMIGRTKKVVCLVGDYFPPHGKWIVRAYRRLANAFTIFVAKLSDEVWTLSPRIPTAKINPQNFLVPLYVQNFHAPATPRTEIGYVGNPTSDHALEILFEICRQHNLTLNIIGDSAYLQSIKSQAPPQTVFHGLISDTEKINAILSRCFCGYAVYRNVGPHNYSYYGFPSKILRFLSSNVPVVTTDIAHFMQNIKKFGIGEIVEPQFEAIERAVLEMKNNFAIYFATIDSFREAWNADVEKFHRERLSVLLRD
jgi:glycosyltransferase involved in cell wall biosynthesis